ncbi:MAG: hypothetical protein AB4426_09985 [Xenococcaceae cyanobacterium]
MVYIGDRATGKTALVMSLIKPDPNTYVEVSNQDYENLKKLLFNEEDQTFWATGGRVDPSRFYESRFLEVQVRLPAGTQRISVDWIDTPGEVWRQSWQEDNPDKWQNILTQVQQSEGIMLILPPYREMLDFNPNQSFVDANRGDFPIQQQWCKRFKRWVEFFRYDCPKARHIVICLNKADLFCDLEQEAFELGYKPLGSRMNWYQRNAYISQRYFQPVYNQLQEIRQKTAGLPIRCFITSIYNRTLLELPWIYLGSHLAS